jgi:hypothetical protein
MDEFNKDQLRYKDPEKRKQYQKDYAKNNKKNYYKLHPEYKKIAADKKKALLRKKKRKIVELLGGRCSNPNCACPDGYSRCIAALELHHPDETTKNENFNNYLAMSMERIIKEVLPIVVLFCSNCHQEHHNPELCRFSITEM